MNLPSPSPPWVSVLRRRCSRHEFRAGAGLPATEGNSNEQEDETKTEDQKAVVVNT